MSTPKPKNSWNTPARREPIPFPADDPRHGTNPGYIAHAFAHETACTPCREAHNAYRRDLRARRYLARSERLYIDSTGTIRRIRALQAIGWRLSDIDPLMGHDPGTNYAYNLTRQPKVHLNTARKIAAVYDELSMRLGPSERTRGVARRNGWAPPLAWDDDTIDDPQARPHGGSRDGRSSIDPIVVERLLAGDRVPSNRAEKEEALRRWIAMGRSQKSLCELHGWHQGRYGRAA